MASDISKRVLENMSIELKFDDSAVDYIVKKGFDHAYGARPLRRALQSEVEDKFAESFLEGKFKNGEKVVVKENNGDMIFDVI